MCFVTGKWNIGLIADIAIQMGVDGHQADLVMLKAAKAPSA